MAGFWAGVWDGFCGRVTGGFVEALGMGGEIDFVVMTASASDCVTAAHRAATVNAIAIATRPAVLIPFPVPFTRLVPRITAPRQFVPAGQAGACVAINCQFGFSRALGVETSRWKVQMSVTSLIFCGSP